MRQLSETFRQVSNLLSNGWSGTYGELAVAVGRSPRSGRIMGQQVKAFARRNPNWPHTNVVAKNSGRPAYEV